MKKIVLCGNYGGINTGDEAILEGFLSVLGQDADVTVLSHNPAHTTKTYSVKSLYVFPMGLRSMIVRTFNGEKNKTLRAIKEADYFILGGGSLFTDEESSKAPLMWSWQSKAAASCKTKIIMFGQTVGPISSAYLQNLTADAFNLADSIYVRDEQSKEFLNSLNVNKPVTVTGDCALLLSLANNAGQIATSVKNFNNPNGPVLFIPRDWPEGPQVSDIVAMLEDATGKTVKLVSLYRDRENFESETTTQRTECVSPQALMDEMRQSSLVVSMRLHGSILASVAGVPFLPLSYSSKVDNFIKEIEYPFIFNWEDFSKEELMTALKKMPSHIPGEVTENISKKATELENYLKTFL